MNELKQQNLTWSMMKSKWQIDTDFIRLYTNTQTMEMHIVTQMRTTNVNQRIVPSSN